MVKLTLEKLKTMEYHDVICAGTINLLVEGKCNWIAIKGGGIDWAIYFDKNTKSFEDIMKTGNKLFTKELIRELVDCDDEVFETYRW